MNNNTLLIFLNNGKKRILSFPLDTPEEKALEFFSKRHSKEVEEIKKYFYIEDDSVSAEVYQNHYELNENQELTMNMRAAFTEKSFIEIKKKRDTYLKALDIPFMMSIENEDQDLKNHIIKVKSFLRNLPENLKYNEIEKDVDILKYNPFSNIFNIFLVHKGSGYTSPPSVTVDSPDFGFQAKATAFISEGKVQRIEMTDYGCGYAFAPKITIAPPEEGDDKAVAACPYPENTVLSSEDIIENTKQRYSS